MDLNQEVLKGTIFKQLFEIMQSGKFAPVDSEPTMGEEIIGTMTELEKAIHTMADHNLIRAKEIALRLDGRGQPYSSDELPQLRREFQACSLRVDTAREMLWNCIKERLHDCDLPDNYGLVIRSDYRIVMRTQPSQPTRLLDLIFGS